MIVLIVQRKISIDSHCLEANEAEILAENRENMVYRVVLDRRSTGLVYR